MNKPNLEIEDSIYIHKEGLCDVKGCTQHKVMVYAENTDKNNTALYGKILFLCDEHAKQLKVKRNE